MPEFSRPAPRLHFHIFGTAGGVEHGALLSSLSPNRGQAVEQTREGCEHSGSHTEEKSCNEVKLCTVGLCRINADQLWQ